MSQDVDFCPSFYFIKCINLCENNAPKVVRFCYLHNIGTKTYINILKHISLEKNVRIAHRKYQVQVLCRYRDIHIKKNKGEKINEVNISYHFYLNLIKHTASNRKKWSRSSCV